MQWTCAENSYELLKRCKHRHVLQEFLSLLAQQPYVNLRTGTRSDMIAICGNIPCNQENEETQTPIMLHKPTCMHATSKRGKHSEALAQSAESAVT